MPVHGRHSLARMTERSPASSALLTDRYELTMLQSTLRDGTAQRSCVFELFARRLSGGRRYGVIAGVGRLLDALEAFRFGEAELDWLREAKVVDEDTIAWLAGYRFSGSIWGYPEGEIYFPYSPVLIVEGTFAECVILETVFLSILNHDSAIASAAARMISAAGDRPCIEMGSRRTHEQSAVSAARAAYVSGFAATSNLEAGRTYDIPEGVALAVEVAGPELGGVRLDSGDLVSLAKTVRKQLDQLGASSTRITVTSDLDEHAIAALASAPVDGYGVGTALVTGSGVPTSSFVYKLVARVGNDGEMVSVAKASKDKVSVGGRKYALRRQTKAGVAKTEVIGIGGEPEGPGRLLLVELVRGGKRIHHESLDAARARLKLALDELPPAAKQLSRGEPVIDTAFEDLS